MNNFRITATIPPKHLSPIIELIEECKGVIEECGMVNGISTKKKIRIARKVKQFRTAKRDAEICEYHKAHPEISQVKLAKKFNHGASTISNILKEGT